MIRLAFLPCAHLPTFPHSLIPYLVPYPLISFKNTLSSLPPFLPFLSFMLSCFHAFLCPRALFPSSTNVPGIFSESHLSSGWQDTLKGHLSAKLNVVTNKVDIAPLKW